MYTFALLLACSDHARISRSEKRILQNIPDDTAQTVKKRVDAAPASHLLSGLKQLQAIRGEGERRPAPRSLRILAKFLLLLRPAHAWHVSRPIPGNRFGVQALLHRPLPTAKSRCREALLDVEQGFSDQAPRKKGGGEARPLLIKLNKKLVAEKYAMDEAKKLREEANRAERAALEAEAKFNAISTEINDIKSEVRDILNRDVVADDVSLPPEALLDKFVRELLQPILPVVAPLLLLPFLPMFVTCLVIPSGSMDATLKVGDVVLSEKVSSALHLPIEPGDLVAFKAPKELEDIVRSNGYDLGSRELFIKRVAAVAGDKVQLDQTGRTVLINGVPRKPAPLACTEDEPTPTDTPFGPAEIQKRVQALLDEKRIDSEEARALMRELDPPNRESANFAAEEVRRRTQLRVLGNIMQEEKVNEEQLGEAKVVPRRSLFVLGDCQARSTDSRVWGPLDERRVVARPFTRVWPLERMGPIETTIDLNPFRRSALKLRQALDEGTFRLALDAALNEATQQSSSD